ncbi:MAG: hypothetical protein LUF29_08115 [Oscillospiraceae bacterium]|nr:hypothetical protein [Oscillospiraceae bacterium]
MYITQTSYRTKMALLIKESWLRCKRRLRGAATIGSGVGVADNALAEGFRSGALQISID